jgi:uncharacterized membrane protein
MGGPAGYQPPQPAAAAPAAGGMSESAASAICYVLGFITGILFLVLAPYNQMKTVRFHAFQSIFLNVALIAIGIGFGILSFVITMVLGHFMGGLIAVLLGLLHLVLMLGFLGLWIYMIIQASQGKKVVLPVIGPLAEKQA